jgi:hypothetical protein
VRRDVESALADEGMTHENASGDPCRLTASLPFDGRTESAVAELI